MGKELINQYDAIDQRLQYGELIDVLENDNFRYLVPENGCAQMCSRPASDWEALEV